MLKRYISLKLAANILLVVLGAFLVLHLVVFFGSVLPQAMNPDEAGGKVIPTQLILMEIGAMVVTALMLLMIAIRVEYLNFPKLKEFSKTAMWVVFVYLLLTTAGNFTNNSGAALLIYTPITIILAVLAYRLAMQEEA